MFSRAGGFLQRSSGSSSVNAFGVIAESWAADRDFHYLNSNRNRPSRVIKISAFLNPSLIASALFRLSANSSGIAHIFFRWLTLTFFASDIASGARFEGAIELPHPTGIVVGRGAVIGANARIFQNVTVGSSRSGQYPVVGNNVTLYSGAVVAGGLIIGDGATIGANCVVTKSVSSFDVVRSA
ncbi:hypothetical protein [Pseudarthrobacter sp. YAF2]|uniref:hypothetical protein n=1 Tax=Pseudarthrobacter sp. YAF2 TaxID=3233078 RepID=UPI003F9B2148